MNRIKQILNNYMAKSHFDKEVLDGANQELDKFEKEHEFNIKAFELNDKTLNYIISLLEDEIRECKKIEKALKHFEGYIVIKDFYKMSISLDELLEKYEKEVEGEKA